MSYKTTSNLFLNSVVKAIQSNTDFDTMILSIESDIDNLFLKAKKAKNEACTIIEAISVFKCINKDFKFVESSKSFINLFTQKDKENLYDICEAKIDELEKDIQVLELDANHAWFKDLDDFHISEELNELLTLQEQVELLQGSIELE